MKKALTAVLLVVALAIPVAALAAELDEGKFGDLFAYGNSECKKLGYEDGAYFYFVNNKTLQWEKQPSGGLLKAKIDGSWTGFIYPAIVFNQYNQHFEVYVPGGSTLSDAETNLAGKLVLSHVTCKGSKIEFEG